MFSWIETVVISLIKHLKDPELVRYFMLILSPIRNNYILEDARSFHISLRHLPSEDIKINKYHPITKPAQLYYHNNTMLRIKFFTPGFIRRVDGFSVSDGRSCEVYVDDYLSEKVCITEKLLEDKSSWESNYDLEEIKSAVDELHGINIVTEKDELWLDIPFITCYGWSDRFGDNYKYIELIN